MALPLCPQCGSPRIARGYAPPRSYALMLTGLALIVPYKLLASEFFSPLGQVHLQRFFAFGVLLLLYGFLDTFRHGRRYCTDCGTLFRQPRARHAEDALQAGHASRSVTHPQHTGASRREEDESATIDPHTPIEPLLKCLRFKNESMRKDAARTLRQLTGESFGPDAEAWEDWWQTHQDEYRQRRKTNHP